MDVNSVLNMFIKSPAKWKLVRVDDPKDFVEGQFQAEDFVRNVENTYARINLLKREPGLAFVGQASRTFSFRATFWNESSLSEFGGISAAFDVTKLVKTIVGGKQKTPTEKLRKLLKFMEKDPKTDEPPLLHFSWGNGDLRWDCRLESLGGIKYDDLWSDGSIKGVSCDLRLVAEPPAVDISPVDPSAPIHLSHYKPVAAGETYESMALAEYGNPLFGTALRQENTVAFPVPGDVVRMPNKDYFVRKGLEPRDYCLSGNEDAQAALTETASERAAPMVMPLVY